MAQKIKNFIYLDEYMVEIRINATFLNCRRELRGMPKGIHTVDLDSRLLLSFCRDSEIAPTDEM